MKHSLMRMCNNHACVLDERLSAEQHVLNQKKFHAQLPSVEPLLNVRGRPPRRPFRHHHSKVTQNAYEISSILISFFIDFASILGALSEGFAKSLTYPQNGPILDPRWHILRRSWRQIRSSWVQKSALWRSWSPRAAKEPPRPFRARKQKEVPPPAAPFCEAFGAMLASNSF